MYYKCNIEYARPTNVSDVPRSLQSWVSTIQSVVLTADVFQFLIQLVCLHSVSVSVCVTFAVFTDCESCTRPITTNPGSMEAGECELTRGTCIIACRLELYAVAGLLWLSCFVLDGARFLLVFFFYFFSSNAHRLLQVWGHLASFTSLLLRSIE